MRRLSCLLFILSVLVLGPQAMAQEDVFGPSSELAGWLWPAAFSLHGARTVAWDFPAAYLFDTPHVGVSLMSRRDADTIAELVNNLQDPYLTVKDPIAAELRRRTGQDFGYADAAPWLTRQRAVSKWADWVRGQQVTK